MRTASFTFLQSHTNQRYLRTYTFPNYDDLIIVFGNGIVVGNNSVELGEDTDARTYRGGENASARIEDYVSDGNSDTDVQSQAEKDDYTSFFLYTIWSMLKQNSLKEGELEKIMKQIVPQAILYTVSQNMNEGNEIVQEDMLEEEDIDEKIGDKEIEEDEQESEMEGEGLVQEYYETIKLMFMAIQAVLQVLNALSVPINGETLNAQ
ncbi:hypothetical protein PS2_003097 [Malus domestica]